MTAAPASLTAALDYAARGWRVVPIRPGAKVPAISNWVEAASSDLELLAQWWSTWPDHGVGIVTGVLPDGSVLFVVDVDEHDPAASGREAILDLQATYQPLPDTVAVQTPSGGRHLYFHAPPGSDIRNDAGRRLGPGLDIRAIGGQVLAPPTLHPSHPDGPAYIWELEHDPDDLPVADAPPWLLALLTQPIDATPRAERVAHDGPPRPGDRFAAAVTWPELLQADGAAFIGQRRDDRSGHGYELWARPGADHASASLYYGGTDVLKVFTSNWPGLTEGQTYTRFGYLVATRHAGNYAQAASELARRQNDDDVRALIGQPLQPAATDPGILKPEQIRAPLDVRWVQDLADIMPPEPPVLIDGLIRQGELCVLGAPRAIGKSWIAMNLATLLARGEGALFGHLDVQRTARVLLLQGELDEWGSATRWKRLTGTRLPPVAESFDRRIRLRTTRRRTTSSYDGTTTSDEHIDAVLTPLLEEAIVEHGIEVVILDPWATYFAGNENSNDEVEAALDKLRGLTLAHGVTWIILHHLSKATEYREPEDAWRGASRLADWASTRVTVLPHYSAKQADEKGLKRHEARRFVDSYVLRRSEPTPDFAMQLGTDGWWRKWIPDPAEEALERHGGSTEAGGRPPTIAMRQFVNELLSDGGAWPSATVAGERLDISRAAAMRIAEHAEAVGIVTFERGPKNSKRIIVTDLGRQKGDRFQALDHTDGDAAVSRETPLDGFARLESRETPRATETPSSEGENESRETSVARNPRDNRETPGQSLLSSRAKPLPNGSGPGPDGPAPDLGAEPSDHPSIEELLG